jgi:putative membrane protein
MWNGPFGDGWGWFWPFHFIFPLLFWALIIVAVVSLVRYAGGSGWHPMGPGMMMGHGMMGHGAERRSSALDVLEERYARGEINRDEYLEKKKDISA